MNAPKRHLTQHRRRRLVLWALAMLTWLASVLFAGQDVTARQFAQRHRKMSLAGLKHMVMKLLLTRAVELARLRRPKRYRLFLHGRALKRRHIIRSVIGSRFRRLLTRKALHERIAVLIDALRRFDHYASLLAKRLKRRLTRLFAIAPAPLPAITLPGAPAPSPARTDTS